MDAFDISRTFVRLDADGGASSFGVTREVWSAGGAASTYDRVMGTFAFETDEDLHRDQAEMHPAGDEVLVVLEGAITVVLEHESGPEPVHIDAGQAAVVPQGLFHHLEVRTPGRLLFVNSRRDMQHRPAQG